MSNKEIVELYATGDWVLLTPSGITSEWMIVESPRWDCDNYKLVHKKHKHILDAYLDGCRIYWKDLVQNTYGIDKNFIEDYKDTWADGLWDYEAIPKSLENCYCEANDLHFCKLVDNGYSFHNNLKAARELDKEEFIKIEDGKNVYYINSNSIGEKKIQFNEQLNNWTYCPYEGKGKNKMKQEASEGKDEE